MLFWRRRGGMFVRENGAEGGAGEYPSKTAYKRIGGRTIENQPYRGRDEPIHTIAGRRKWPAPVYGKVSWNWRGIPRGRNELQAGEKHRL